MDARPVLGVSAVRPTLLVHLPTAQPREGQAGRRASRVSHGEYRRLWPTSRPLRLDDDFDDDYDEDEEDGDEDDDEDEDEETETWQVSSVFSVAQWLPSGAAFGLTSDNDLPRLAKFSEFS